MFEVNEDFRLIRHHGHQTTSWSCQERVKETSIYKCIIWKPVTGLMDSQQMLSWLSEKQIPSSAVQAFLHVRNNVRS